MSTTIYPVDSDCTTDLEQLFYYPADVRHSSRQDIVRILVGLAGVWAGQIVLPIFVQVIFAVGIVWQVRNLVATIRLDRSGISRRVLWWWDLWPWEDFTNGRIGFGKTAFSFIDRQRWWRGTLRYDQLEECDIQIIYKRVRDFLFVPPSEIPSEVTVRIGRFVARSVRLSEDGVVVCNWQHQKAYAWHEIQVTIWRFEPDRPDFNYLWLSFPDQPLLFEQQGRSSNWRGASAEDLAAIVGKYCEPMEMKDFSLHGAPRSLEELDGRWIREECMRNNDSSRQVSLAVLLGLNFVATFIAMFQNMPIVGWSLVCSSLALFGLYRGDVLKAKKHQREYELLRMKFVMRDVEMGVTK